MKPEFIRGDQRRREILLESLIIEALTSGKSSRLTKANIDNARKTVKNRIAARRQK